MWKTIASLALLTAGIVLVIVNHIPLGVCCLVAGAHLLGISMGAAEVQILREANLQLVRELEAKNRATTAGLVSPNRSFFGHK